jgi:succinate dehydrogenase flavin-adding protein (antitoxin of CptAB toxin-antitoxin module)
LKTKTNLPDFIKKYFWDINPEDLDINEDYFIILERLLNYADDKTLNWILKHYEKKQIKEVVKNSRRLNPKTANFWQKHFNLRKEDIKCTQKPCPKTGKKF